ncbi:MAG TPA: PA2169 family four-helix-bundle protein [Lacibacter sp.]|jgi:uncharacterized protein (TIGR02284 family)|nr:PA2169 family four-helix-bundle protein [Lacibacter sp.]
MKEKSIVEDLIQINHDRIAGYLKVTEQIAEPRLKHMFAAKVAQSRLFVDQLKRRDLISGPNPAENGHRPGNIYNTWVNLGATFNCTDHQAALDCCAYGEDATLKAYDKALEHDIDLPLRSLLIEQENGLRQSHAEVRSMAEQQVRASASM